MNYMDSVTRELIEMDRAVYRTMRIKLETWANVAYKLDFISFDDKEAFDMVVRMWRECQALDKELHISNKSFLQLVRIKEIARNTIIPYKLIESAQR